MGGVESGADGWRDGRVWGGGMDRVEEAPGVSWGRGGGDGSEGGGMCGRRTEPNRTP